MLSFLIIKYLMICPACFAYGVYWLVKCCCHVSARTGSYSPNLPPPSEAFRLPDTEDARGSGLSSGRSLSFSHAVQTPRNVVMTQCHTGALNGVLEAKLTGCEHLGNKSTHVCPNKCGLVGRREIPMSYTCKCFLAHSPELRLPRVLHLCFRRGEGYEKRVGRYKG